MAEELHISQKLSKAEKYQQLLPQLEALVKGENDTIANLANLMAALKQAFNFWWVGVYLVKNDELVLGPFQGPIACTRIKKGKGVCGTAWQEAKTIIVDDVEQFLGHIACSSESKSEIVVPVFNKNKEVIMVIDVDSEVLNAFDETDAAYLEKIAQLISDIA
ncbi:MAG: GAF domain-containing protein [Vicingaceae bacterium]|nr:GAF domain-containing protein [Vicingaceae bacterium]